METASRECFTFYRSFLTVAEEMPEEEQLPVFKAIARFALDGVEPESLGPFGRVAWTAIRPVVAAGRAKALAGAGGGRANAGKSCPGKNGNRNAAKADADAPGAAGAESSTGKGRARFAPPTVEEVAAYCRERKNGIDAEHFVAVYQASGWKLANGNALRDWKAAVRTWEGRDKARGGRAPGGSAPAAQAPVDLFRDDDEGL